MNPLLQQLHDIDSIDAVSIWPLAIGWWILIFAAIGLIAFTSVLLYKWIKFKRSWKNDTLKKLSYLEGSLSDSSSIESVILFSEYMRRIALRRFSRRECASLVDEEWLKWLSKHDPKEFNWQKNGKLLTQGPYAPQHQRIDIEELKTLIHAAKEWVR